MSLVLLLLLVPWLGPLGDSQPMPSIASSAERPSSLFPALMVPPPEWGSEGAKVALRTRGLLRFSTEAARGQTLPANGAAPSLSEPAPVEASAEEGTRAAAWEVGVRVDPARSLPKDLTRLNVLWEDSTFSAAAGEAGVDDWRPEKPWTVVQEGGRGKV